MSYCLYLRKSRADKELEKTQNFETLIRHEEILLEFAKSKNFKINKIYKEIVSGETIKDRPEIKKLLQEVKQNFYTGVIVMEIERLARGNTIDQGIIAETFKASNTKIITPFKTYNPNNEFDEEYFEFSLFMSRREYKTINRRIQQGRLASVKEGKFIASIAPYGYEKIKLKNQKGYTLKIVEDKAKVVKLIYDLYINGINNKKLSLSQIANYLDNLKIPPPKNEFWSNSTIKNILSNPTYIGKIRWDYRKTVKIETSQTIKRSRPIAKNYLLIKGLHPPIITTKTFDLAQKYIKTKNISPISKNKTLKNSLSGLIKCGICGKNMIRKPAKSPQKDILICSSNKCKNISSYLNIVEEKLLDTLQLLENKNLIKIEYNQNINLNIENEFLNKNIKLLQASLKKTNFQINKLYEFLEQEIYDKITFQKRYKLLNEKKQEITNNIKKFNDKLNILNQTNIKNFQSIKEFYNNNDIESKNIFLKSIIKKVIYLKTKNCRWHNNLKNFDLKIILINDNNNVQKN